MNMEFLSYHATPAEKYAGIATMRYERRFIFRFKIVPKEKEGYFVQAASHKITQYGKDAYISSFQIDSQYESDEIKAFVLAHVEQAITKTTEPIQQIKEPGWARVGIPKEEAYSQYPPDAQTKLPF